MIGFDTLHAAQTLIDAGVEMRQAKAIVAAMAEAVGEPVTADDLEPLATRAELERFATKEDLEAAVRPLATKSELEAAVRPLATKSELERLATKEDLERFATEEDLEAAIMTLATKVELAGVRNEVAALRTTIAEQHATLTWRIVLALGAFVALVRIFP